MATGIARPRVVVGAGVRLVSMDEAGIEIEGPIRLSPGRTVDVTVRPHEGQTRLAVVWTWTLVKAGRAGAIYRGVCRWVG